MLSAAHICISLCPACRRRLSSPVYSPPLFNFLLSVFLFFLSTSQSHIHAHKLTIIYLQSHRSTIIHSLTLIYPQSQQYINNQKNTHQERQKSMKRSE
jgi:hypothetical protein